MFRTALRNVLAHKARLLMTVLAVIGVTALWLTFGWLAITIVCQYLSERKGYGLRLGLGLLFFFRLGGRRIARTTRLELLGYRLAKFYFKRPVVPAQSVAPRQ